MQTTLRSTATTSPVTSRAAQAGLGPRLARALIRFLFGLAFRPRLEGTLPASGPYIVAANHQGWADAFLIVALLPVEPRVHFLADHHGVSTHWWKRAVLAAMGGVVHADRTRRAADRSALDASLDVLDQGAVLAIFPEGRVSHCENDLAAFRRGIGYLALKSGAPVLPMWLSGTADLYLGRELVARVGELRSPRGGEPTKEATEAFVGVVRADVAALETKSEEPAGTRKLCRWLTRIL